MLFTKEYKAVMEEEYKSFYRSTFRPVYSEQDEKWLRKESKRLKQTEGWQGSVQDTKDQIRRQYELGTICMPWRWIKPNTLALNYLIHKGRLPCT